MYREKIQLLLAKVETTSGVDATPSPTLNAIRTVGIPGMPKIAFLEDGKRADVEMGTLGTVGRARPAGRYASFDVTLEVCGAGAAYSSTVVPEIDPFLRAAGLSRAFSGSAGSEQVLYTTLDTGMETMTVYAYSGGKLVKLLGCVFQPKFTFDTGKRIMLSGTVTGKVAADVTEVAVPAHAFTSTLPILFHSATATIGGWDSASGDPLMVHKADLDFGTTISDLPSAGATDGLVGYAITNRLVRQSMDLSVASLTAFDPYLYSTAAGLAGSVPGLTYGGGTVLYNRLTVQAGLWQIESPARGNRNLISTYSLAGDLVMGAAPTTAREINLLFT